MLICTACSIDTLEFEMPCIVIWCSFVCFVLFSVLPKRFHFKKNLRRIITELYIRDNCHPFKATLLVWVQIPMWVCVSLALRNCSVGALDSEGDLFEFIHSKQSFVLSFLFIHVLI